MQKKYIFPEVAKRVEVSINKHLKNGDYDKTSSSQAFAKLLTEHLQAETHDKHLHIRFEEEEIPVFDGQGEPSPEDLANADIEEMTFMKSINFGVERVERLPGNIGYLDFRGFGDTEKVGHAIAAAMTLLNASDALIIDLRKNGGGSPSTVALLASYFVPPKTHL
jgi:C-terminal processing protease CtpA/Prc